MTEVERIVSRARRGRAVFVGVVVLLCLGATFAIVDIGQESRITNVERSTCAKDPAGEPCQRTKRQSDRNRSIADTCIAFWKVGYACPKPGSKTTSSPAPRASEPTGADQPSALQPTFDNGGSGPPNDGADKEPKPKHAGSNESPAPPDPGTGGEASPAAPVPTPGVTAPGGSASTPDPAEESGPVTSTLGDVGDTVHTTVCSLAERLLQHC